ncbi:MAG: hypothetical protein MMC33_005534 [Icmadophila ericetorum]|nr:hypothetical protein [Icmadophila ericetorum]
MSRPSAFHTSSTSTSITNHNRQRQYAHLQSQLAQLAANLSDTENLLRMTAIQAEHVRDLGAYWGSLFMASSKILGEETARGGSGAEAIQEGKDGDVDKSRVDESREGEEQRT